MRAFANCLIQFVWLAASFVAGYYIAHMIFDSDLLSGLFTGIFGLLVYFLLFFIQEYIKAFKDPDVRAASALGMSLIKYKKLKKYSDEQEKEVWKGRFNIGNTISVTMEDGYLTEGQITAIDKLQRLYIVSFKEPISLMPSEEPEGGWVDNAFPEETLRLTEEEVLKVLKKELIGTNLHYHF